MAIVLRRNIPLTVAVLLAAATLALSGCTAETAAPPENTSTRVCAVLPDTSSPRWETVDRVALTSGVEGAGFEVDVQNAEGDAERYGEIVDAQLEDGCGVVILAEISGAAGSAESAAASAAEAAHAAGATVIGYGGSFAGADYAVAPDEAEIGRLQGQSLVDALTAAGKTPAVASAVFLGADAATTAQHDAATATMRAAGVRPAAQPIGPPAEAAAQFAAASAGLSGRVEAVWASTDAYAAGAISDWQAAGLAPVPLTGRGASIDALRNIVAGWQTSTVYTPAHAVADAAVALAESVLNDDEPATTGTLADSTPYVAVAPVLIGPADVATVITAGEVAAADVCAGDAGGRSLVDACAALGIG